MQVHIFYQSVALLTWSASLAVASFQICHKNNYYISLQMKHLLTNPCKLVIKKTLAPKLLLNQ